MVWYIRFSVITEEAVAPMSYTRHKRTPPMCSSIPKIPSRTADALVGRFIGRACGGDVAVGPGNASAGVP